MRLLHDGQNTTRIHCLMQIIRRELIFGKVKVKVTQEHAMKGLAQCRGTAPLFLLTSTPFELYATRCILLRH